MFNFFKKSGYQKKLEELEEVGNVMCQSCGAEFNPKEVFIEEYEEEEYNRITYGRRNLHCKCSPPKLLYTIDLGNDATNNHLRSIGYY